MPDRAAIRRAVDLAELRELTTANGSGPGVRITLIAPFTPRYVPRTRRAMLDAIVSARPCG